MSADERITTYLIGLDLGQAADPTALSIVERYIEPADETEQERKSREEHRRPRKWIDPVYSVVYLERFALRTEYTTIADRVKEICLSEPMSQGLRLLVDGTGVGRAVMDMLDERLFKSKIFPIGITITGGDKVTRDGSNFRVPKRDLVAAVRVPLEDRRLLFAEDLELLRVLKQELQDFRVKVTKSANDIYEAREGEHDDIVLSVSLPVWYGENYEARGPAQAQGESYNKNLQDVMNRLARIR